jgi:hypothetical protein
VVEFCGKDNEISGFVKCLEILQQLSEWWLLKLHGSMELVN